MHLIKTAPSLYAAYLREKEGYETIEHPEGFINFKVVKDECYIRDVYVLPEHRRFGVATHLADEISSIGKKRGCKLLVSSIIPEAPNSNATLKVALSYGMRLHSSQQNMIFFVKELT